MVPPPKRHHGNDGDLASLSRPISPPPTKRAKGERDARQTGNSEAISHPQQPAGLESAVASRTISSPFRLSWIRDVEPADNVGALTIHDILGDPLIAECWNFNYLHDVDLIMDALDADVRRMVRMNIVHGFWKSSEPRRQHLEEQAARYENVRLHAAYMPHMFGTHHTKMIVLFRHDDTAQVVIHTANMIVRDWTNMTQGIWLSPLLPLLPESQHARDPLGPGERFKRDLISYIQAYSEGARHGRGICGALAKELLRYDFSAVRARLIASVPGTHPTSAGPGGETLWGWAGLRQALSEVEIRPASDGGKAEIVAQVSSIATLGATDAWLRGTLFAAMETGKEVAASGADNGPTDSVRGGSGTLTLSKAKTATASRRPRPSFKVVFPTAPEIRRSLDGYESGASIHTKTQSPQQQRQLDYLRPMLCRWANDMDGRSPGRQLVDGSAGHAKETKRWLRDGGRNRAAPHIKTYIRYYYPSSFPSDGPTIDWALLTSANISKQAWGEAANGNGETMRIASWEVGVLVWPALLAGDAGAGPTTTRMIPVFKTDEPTDYDRGGKGKAAGASDLTTIGLRVPYSLPLEPYAPGEQPWVATAVHTIPDWMGRVWSE